jgi:hypothetical protein
MREKNAHILAAATTTAGIAALGAVALTHAPRPVKALRLGNRDEFSPVRVELNPNSALYGKRIGFLGSSITYGAAARGVSFVEYLQAGDGVLATKSAISGTTLAGTSPRTYVSRLVSDFSTLDHYDLFVCQLSTNDSRAHKALGTITPDDQRSGFDRDTTLGAIEFICEYVRKNFDCPVMFYTCVRKPDDDYARLVAALFDAQKKWGFGILDLWRDPVVKSITALSPYAMMDDAHPTRLGYQKIWTPLFRHSIEKILAL